MTGSPGKETGLGLGCSSNSADAGSLYSVKAPPLFSKIDKRYSQKTKHTTGGNGAGNTGLNTGAQLQSHHMGHSRFMSVHDLPPDAYMEGLSIISSNTSVNSLMSEDDAYVREVFNNFVSRVQEEQNKINDDEDEKVGVSQKQKSAVVGQSGKNHLGDTKGAGSTRSNRVVAISTKLANSHRLTAESRDSGDAILEGGLEMIIPSEEAALPYRLMPWRCVFQTWVRRLSDELLNLHSNTSLISLELFVRRAKDACNNSTDALQASLQSPNSKSRSRKAFNGLAADSEKPMVSYSDQLPHPLSQAACMYVFDIYLIPLFGEHAPTVRRAFHELVLATFTDPPPTTNLGGLIQAGGAKGDDGTGRGDSAISSQAKPTLLSNHDESTAYLRPTYLQRFHELKHVYIVLRESNRRSVIVMERQDTILNKSLFKMQKQTAKRLLSAWYVYTQRNIKLRARYRKVFLGLSDSATVKVSLKNWQAAARTLKAKQRHKKNAGGGTSNEYVEPAMKERTRQMKLRHEMTTLIQQKQMKTTIMEEGVATNRRLMEKRSEFSERLKAAHEKHHKISATWAGVVEDLLPAPSTKNFQMSFDRFHEEGGQLTCFEDTDTLEGELFSWIVEVSRRDDSISGRKLVSMLKSSAQEVGANPNQVSHISGVLSRVTHLLPILRATLTILTPPNNFAILDAGVKLPDFVQNSPTKDSRFVAFGDVGTEIPLVKSPELVKEDSMGTSQHNVGSDDGFADTLASLVPELSVPGTDSPRSRRGSAESGMSSLASKHAKISVAIQEHLLEGRKTSVDEESLLLSPGGKSSSRRGSASIKFNIPEGSQSPKGGPSKSRSVVVIDANDDATALGTSTKLEGEDDFEKKAISSMSRRRSFASLHDDTLDDEAERKAQSLLMKRSSLKGASDTLTESFARKAAAQAAAALNDPYTERKIQLELVLKPLSDVHDATSFCSYLLSLLQKITKASGVTFTKLLPSNYTHRLTRQMDDWRNLLLGYLYMSQYGNNSGCFRLLPTSAAPASNASSPLRKGSSWGGASLSRSSRAGGANLGSHTSSLARLNKKRGTGAGAGELERPQFNQASEMKRLWDNRMRKRKFARDDERAVMATRVHEMYMANLVDTALSGGETLREAERLYKLYSSACPTIANNTVITADFLAKKLRVVFGHEKTHWYQANVGRRITSGREMEEYLRTMSVATRVGILDLCERLTAAADDTDYFFSTIGTREVQEAFEAHVADLSVVFSLYSSGTPPNHFITKEGWVQLTQAFLDSNFTNVLAAEAFEKVMERNSNAANPFRAVTGGDALLANPPSAAGGVNPPEASGNLVVDRRGAGGDEGSAPSGLNMDAFCQALCVVVAFKVANPFTPLDAKIPVFIVNWLVPMAGTKVKGGKSGTSSSEAQARIREAAAFVPLTNVL